MLPSVGEKWVSPDGERVTVAATGTRNGQDVEFQVDDDPGRRRIVMFASSLERLGYRRA